VCEIWDIWHWKAVALLRTPVHTCPRAVLCGIDLCSQALNTTVVVMVLGRVAPVHCSKRCRTARSSASCAIACAPSGREESVMAPHSTHLPPAADGLPPKRLGDGREYPLAPDACLSATAPASAATPALRDRSRLAHRPCRLPLAPPPHPFLAKCQLAS